MKFQIHGEDFWIDEFPDGFAWVSKKDEGTIAFKTEFAAYCNALECFLADDEAKEREYLQRIEDETYGTYEQQVQQYYNSTRL